MWIAHYDNWVVSPANGFSNLSPRNISFRTGGIITCVIGIVIMPWRLYNDLGDYIFTWLIGYSALLGPIAGIMLCDYFVVRKMKLNCDALYDEKGMYSGFRWSTVVVLVIAVLPNVPGFWNAASHSQTFPPIFDQIYTYAWFVGIVIAIVLYAALNLGEKKHA